MTDQTPVETAPEYLDPEERLARERAEKRDIALRNAEDATTDDLVHRKPMRFKVAVNIGTLDEPEFRAITFEGIGRERWEEMLDEFTPDPTDDVPNPDEDAEAMFPHLVSECAVVPKLTLEQAKTIQKTWPKGEQSLLYQAAIRVNVANRMEVLGNV